MEGVGEADGRLILSPSPRISRTGEARDAAVAATARIESYRRPTRWLEAAATSGGTVGEKLARSTPSRCEAAQRGDRAAFDAIVDLYDERLRLLAFHWSTTRRTWSTRRCRTRFFNAFRGLPAFHRRSTLGTWLYRITYTVCMGYLRRNPTEAASATRTRRSPSGPSSTRPTPT